MYNTTHKAKKMIPPWNLGGTPRLGNGNYILYERVAYYNADNGGYSVGAILF
jgi:hypothetical protein